MIEGLRSHALWIRRLPHGGDEYLIEERRVADEQWRDNPDRRPGFEHAARYNNRPLPGSSISDEEYIAQRRDGLRMTYAEKFREYAEAIRRAADAGLRLPPIPRPLYDDLMALEVDFEAHNGEWLPHGRGLAAFVGPSKSLAGPILPQGVEVTDEGDDGDR